MKILEKILFNRILFFILAFVLVLLIPLNVKAANGTVTFGSESYEKEDGESFPIGIYVRGETDISEYRVELKYDSKRLKYLTGAEEVNEEEGLLTFYGNMNGAEEAKLWLELQAQSGGEVTLEVVNASAKNSLGEEYTMTELSSVKVVLNGEDKFAAEEQALREAEEQARLAEEQTRLEAEEQARLEAEEQARLEAEEKERQEKLQAEKEKEKTDSEQAEPEAKNDKKDKNEKTGTIVFPKKAIVYIFLAVALIFVVSIIVFMVLGKRKENTGIDISKTYPVDKKSKNENKYVYDESDDIEIIDFDSSEYDILVGNEEIPAAEINAKTNEKSNNNQALSVETILSENEGVSEGNNISKEKSEKNADDSDKNNVKDNLETSNAAAVEDLKVNQEGLTVAENKENNQELIQNNVPLGTELGEPIIKVDDVTMRFKISTSNASGIKEYLIQRLKRQVSYRELLALDHVSFDVFKGEVVGIIGTNGSGKSTLLKIVSGALEPTSGKVYVDRRKIQLLMLGTGFDMELSARENVYLNGSIIGYSKEFIDKHYARIVKFAELDGFMEEKVKNFSSGMVSRLGFAIATAGEAAEILILDEVLSVGDEFFRKKSLKRIKEMIHGGSTVIMVSHGMNTILDNCSKVVWIEKGKLRMVGEPKTVCNAYREMENEHQ